MNEFDPTFQLFKSISSMSKTAVMLTDETQQRLRDRRRSEKETIDETINRLLDETLIELTLEEAIETAIDTYDDITAVTIDHPGLQNPGFIFINVWSPDVPMPGEEPDVFTPAHRVTIEREDHTIHTIPVVQGCVDGPETADSREKTTIHVTGTVHGEEPIPLDDGIEHLQNKLQRPAEWEAEFGSNPLETYLHNK